MRRETPTHFQTICLVEFVHVHGRAVVDPIPSPGIAPDNFEVPFGIKLFALMWGQPISQETQPACFASIVAKIVPPELAQGHQARSPGRKRATKLKHDFWRRLTADKPRKENRFFSSWIERASSRGFPWASANGGREALTGQLFEPLLCLR
jgi:hypothetical protein